MLPHDLLNELRQAMAGRGPAGASEARALLNSLMTRFNLVSREEFDAQSAVLARTRAKLEALEVQLAELQARHKS